MELNPYVLLAKIGAAIALLIAVWFHGHKVGENAVQADWDASRVALAEQTAKLVLEHSLEMDAVRKRQDAINVQVSRDFEGKLDEIGKSHAAELDRVRKSGGLRLPGSICPGSTSTGTQTTGPGRVDEASTVRLPTEVEERLFALAKSADETAIQLLELQKWISLSGLYTAPNEKPNDHVTAEATRQPIGLGQQ